MGLFNPRPKKNLSEFFDMEMELEEFMRYVKSSPLTLVLGLRRYGKTSLIFTGLNALNLKYLYIDCRILPLGMIGIGDFAHLLATAFNDFIKRYKPVRSTLLKLLENINGVTVGALGVSINLRRFNVTSLVDLIENLDELNERLILVIDEAQELRRLARYSASQLLAYIYDNLPNVGVVVSGSQVGLLYRTLQIDKPGAPLYGRAYVEVRLKRLNKELSKEFLEKGFKEEGLTPPAKFINYVVDHVDGVIGWLTYVGFRTSIMKTFTKKTVDKVLDEASKIVLEELEHFLSLRPTARKRYIEALRAISLLEKASWSNVYNYMQAKLGRIPKPTFNNILKSLRDAGFIEKRESFYVVADPILRNTLKRRIIK